MSSRREKQLENWIRNIAVEFEGLRHSWRWRVGHALVSVIEKVLLRKPVPLATDRIAAILQAFHASRHEVLLDELRAQPGAAWRLGEELPGKPLTDYCPLTETNTAFSAAIAECRAADPLQADRLTATLADADAVLAAELRDLAAVDGPLVSVIMPTWQRADLVMQAIESVREQHYANWELIVCDDGSTDATAERVKALSDSRLRYLALRHAGAAAARNAGLAEAGGDIIAYLDSDNLWHPRYLERIVLEYLTHAGTQAVACNYLDVEFLEQGLKVRERWIDYSWERLAEKNFIDLNSFSHRRTLYDIMGGFTESLPRRQDWDFFLKLLFRFDPVIIDEPLCLYRRNVKWQQLTHTAADATETASAVIAGNLERYYSAGTQRPCFQPRPRRVTVLVWDVCRNHMAKAWNLAEALSRDYETQLIGFRFFDENIFAPYREAEPTFETRFFDGKPFPEFGTLLGQALLAISGDIIYCVKPRLPSFGLALLHNYHFGTPVICESNDLESGVTRPGESRVEGGTPTAAEADYRQPWHDRWTSFLEQRLAEWPFRATHNSVHDAWLGGGCFRIMNIKDERAFEPRPGLRAKMRAKLGLADDEFVLLFGGLVRRHKGVFELLEFVRAQAGQSPVRLLVVGSRASPEYAALRKLAGGSLTVLEPQDRNAMAGINAAADAVLLWLNPSTEASAHQMPFKMTDAMAMQVPVLVNPVGDLAALANRGLVRAVPFGDFDALQETIRELRENPEATRRMVERARNYYLRRFSYQAVRDQFAAMERQIGHSGTTHPAAVKFARTLDNYLAALERAAK